MPPKQKPSQIELAQFFGGFAAEFILDDPQGDLPGSETPDTIPHGETTPVDPNVAIASVPIAQDGMVIDANFHNSLRSALVALAGSVGAGTVEESSRVTLAPAFHPVPGEKASWRVTPEAAEGLDGSTGWLPVDLPPHVRLHTLVVSHTAGKDTTSLEVSLERTSIANSSTTRLFRLKRSSGDGTPKIDTAALEVGGITGPAALEEFRRVDNTTYRYFIRASTTGSPNQQTDHIRVHALQVIFTP
jgi:hypothetical protein